MKKHVAHSFYAQLFTHIHSLNKYMASDNFHLQLNTWTYIEKLDLYLV